MKCRERCGACCIAPSIVSPLPGMPDGKPAGVRCVNLLDDLRCGVWGRPDRPAVCGAFQADAEVCGDDREQALALLAALERATAPLAGSAAP